MRKRGCGLLVRMAGLWQLRCDAAQFLVPPPTYSLRAEEIENQAFRLRIRVLLVEGILILSVARVPSRFTISEKLFNTLSWD